MNNALVSTSLPSTLYLSGSRSRNLNGDFIAQNQNSFSSAINGKCRPDFAQSVNVSEDAVSANTVFNFIVLKTEPLSSGTVTVLLFASRRIRWLLLWSVYSMPPMKSNSPRSALPWVDDESGRFIYFVIIIYK